MTATNHAITGALVASFVPNPATAIPLAFLAHFLMDAIPHFGIHIGDELSRNKTRLFKVVLISDLALAGLLLLSIPLLLSENAGLTLACMLACMSPDVVWGYRFFYELQENRIRQKNFFSRFHTKIQWSETPKGLLVEVAWFAMVLSLVLANV